MVISRQLQYIKEKDLGYDSKKVWYTNYEIARPDNRSDGPRCARNDGSFRHRKTIYQK